MWEVAKLAQGQILTLLPSKFVSPFLDSKGKDTAPCHHSIGIRIIKHGIICPQTSPCLFIQPDGSHKPNANESLPADFVKLEAQQANKPASASVSSLCWSHTDMSPTGACLCQQLRHLDIYLWREHLPSPFSCSGPYSYTRNFRLKLAKVLREGVSTKTWEKINLNGNP